MSVYLIHFDRPYRHARHYVGFSTQVKRRAQHHRAGRGARLMGVVTEAGIDWHLARVWCGATRHFERRMKNRAFGPLEGLCPTCCAVAGWKPLTLRAMRRAWANRMRRYRAEVRERRAA